MQPLLVLRPFTSHNILMRAPSFLHTARNDPLLNLSGRSMNDVLSSNPLESISLSGIFKPRRWPATEEVRDRRLKVVGLVNTGNFCFMNSILQVPTLPLMTDL